MAEQSVDSYPKPFSNEIKYDRDKVLGRGISVVYRGNYNGRSVAVKRIVVDSLSKEDREVRTQVKLDHDNVLKILTVEQDVDFRYIVLELCAGTLADVCSKTYKGPDLPADLTVLIEIATGLQYIHSKKLIHRDIKPDNILISLDGRIKLSDFGLCKETSTNHTCSVSGPLKGTKLWMPQELLNVHSTTDSTPIKGSIKSDIFSAGCVFFYFVTRGLNPFGEEIYVIANIINDKPTNLDKLIKTHFASDVIRKMLRHKPNERISLEQVIEQLEYQITLEPSYNRVANVVRRMSQKSAISYGIDIYNLPFEESYTNQRVDRFFFGKTTGNNPQKKTILMMGDLSSGKSTLINAMVNYVLGVEWDDDFRFNMIDGNERNTQDLVNFYHLNQMKGSRLAYPLTIVDTPNFTVHSGKDQVILQQLQDYFRSTNEVDELDAVCFVIQSPFTVLTHTPMDTIDLILTIIDFDVVNIRLMTTIAENLPPVLGAVKQASDLFSEDPENGTFALPYFLFNSSAFFTTKKGGNNSYKRAYFDMTVKSFDKFFDRFKNLEASPIVSEEQQPRRWFSFFKKMSFNTYND